MATITKRGSGWYAQVRLKGYQPQSKLFTSKVEAAAWARDQEAKIDQARAPVNHRLLRATTLRDILERYLIEITPLKDSSADETARIRKILRTQSMCDITLAELTAQPLAAYRNERLRVVAPGTVRRELGLIRHALEVARKEWDIGAPVNPMSSVALPKLRHGRDRRLNHGDSEALEAALSKCRNKLVPPVVRFAIETAMRRKEILQLRWQDVRLPTRTLYIYDTKTDTPRTIPLTDGSVAILEERKKDGLDGLVFPLSAEALKLSWKRVVRRAGLGDLHFHDLRHEAISRFCEMGLSISEVALISGHRDPRMMRYTHLRPQVCNDNFRVWRVTIMVAGFLSA